MITILLILYVMVGVSFFQELDDRKEAPTLYRFFLSIFWIFALSELFACWLYKEYSKKVEE